MKNLSAHVICFAIIASLMVPAGLLAQPRQVSAQSGTVAACAAAFTTSAATQAPGSVQEAVGVPSANVGRFLGDIFSGGSVNTNTLTTCILKPLGQALVIALIRNIGASVVNWVNSGFEGKPLFVTDFEGTLLNAADQVMGTFIEGTELGFLCKDFSFKIRLELALKYSRPFQDRITCTLSKIGDNIENFVQNNGGAGWDNWLSLTARPTNNVYGAYLVAESELAQRAGRAKNIQEKKITIGSGFLNFDTCDEYESAGEARARTVAASNANISNPSVGTASINPFSVAITSQQIMDENLTNYLASETSFNASPATLSEFTSNFDSKPQCKPGKMTTKTPGKIIADKLSSVLGQSEIQSAVATEIDHVIAATLNQIAQKAISGASGLLGLSKKRSTSGPTYLDRYRAQYYGTALPASTDIGAGTELDDYRIGSIGEAQGLFTSESNPNIRNINEAANAGITASTNQQSQQQASLVSAFSSGNATANAALLKPTSQSSGTNPGGAVDGITQTNQYVKGSSTYEDDANPWWEVNLGQTRKIQEIRIWKVSDKSGADSLGMFTISAKTSAGEVWLSSVIDGGQTNNPIVVPVNQNASAIRIQKNAAVKSCNEHYQSYSGNASCYRPLELAEVEVIEVMGAASTTGTATNQKPDSPSQSSSTNNDPNSPVTVASQTGTAKSGDVFGAEISVSSPADRSIGSLEVAFESSTGQPVTFDDAFSQITISMKQNGVTRNFQPASNSSITFTGVSTGPSHDSRIILTGQLKTLPPGASYTTRVTAKGSDGAVLSVGTIKFTVPAVVQVQPGGSGLVAQTSSYGGGGLSGIAFDFSSQNIKPIPVLIR